MNIHSKYSPVLLSITGIVILLLLFGWLYIENEKENFTYTISQINSNCDKLLQSDSYRKKELNYNGKNISYIVTDTSTMSELKGLVDDNKLILFFAESSNLANEIENLSGDMQKFKQNIILLIRSDNKRFSSIFKNNNKIEYPCLHIQTDKNSPSAGLPPIYFILEKETLRINSSFIPQRDKTKETGSYYEKIIADYFTKTGL